jgi:multicomponent Na+:H+ antiporter subunit G
VSGGAAGVVDLVFVALVLAGAFFFLAGTVGILRFPDVYSRLHALTKADNLGLGLLVVALSLRAEAWHERALLVVVWLLALAAAAAVCHLLARTSLREGVPAVGWDASPGDAPDAEAMQGGAPSRGGRLPQVPPGAKRPPGGSP